MTDGWPRVQFVESPDIDADVRYDLNDGTAGPLADGWSLGSPSLEGDPDSIGTEWNYRELSFTQSIRGQRTDVMWHINALRREMYRRSNWLLFQLDPGSAPVWFQTYRSASGSLSFDRVYVDGNERPDDWEIEVRLRARPWAVGEEVTFTRSYALDPNPSGGNPAYDGRFGFFLPTIKGDVPTPATVKWSVANRTVADGWLSVSPTVDQTRTIWWKPGAAGTAPSSVVPGRYRVVTLFSGVGPSRFGVSADGGVTTLWNTDATVTSSRYAVPSGSAPNIYWFRDLGDVTIRSSDGAAIAPYIKLDLTGVLAGDNYAIFLVPILQEDVGELASVMSAITAPRGGPTAATYVQIDDSDEHDHQWVYINGTDPRGSVFAPGVSGASQLMLHPQWENQVNSFGRHVSTDYTRIGLLTFTYRPRYTDLAGD